MVFYLTWHQNRSYGQVIKGGDSCSERRGFESQDHLLDGHFFTCICCKICSLIEKTNINEKEAGDGPFY